MPTKPIKTKPYKLPRRVKENARTGKEVPTWNISFADKKYSWSNKMERVNIIREGISFDIIEQISERLDRPVKATLSMLGIAQTTYNKKKSEQATLDSHESELIVLITEMLDYGLEVFNNEEDKFGRWLKKPNLSLGGFSPDSLLDTVTGIDEVRYCLQRIDAGSFA